MNGQYLEAIRTHYGDVEDLTDFKCIIGKMVSKGLLDFHEMEELELPGVPSYTRNRKVFDFVRRKENSKFDVLVQLLLTKDCYKSFAIRLHKTCYGTEPSMPTSSEVLEVTPEQAVDDMSHLLSASNGGRKPMMSELMKDVVPRIAGRWKQFASIMNLPYYVIEEINANNAHLGVEECCRQLLSRLQQRNPDMSWQDIINGVSDIGLDDLAEELSDKYVH